MSETELEMARLRVESEGRYPSCLVLMNSVTQYREEVARLRRTIENARDTFYDYARVLELLGKPTMAAGLRLAHANMVEALACRHPRVTPDSVLAQTCPDCGALV